MRMLLALILILIGCDKDPTTGNSSCLIKGPIKISNVKVYGAQQYTGANNIRLVKRTSSILPKLGNQFSIPLMGSDVITNGGHVSGLLLDSNIYASKFPVTVAKGEELAIEFYEQVAPGDLKLTCDFIVGQ